MGVVVTRVVGVPSRVVGHGGAEGTVALVSIVGEGGAVCGRVAVFVPVMLVEGLHHVLGAVYDEGDRDKVGEDLLRRPRRVLHQNGHVERRVYGEEKCVPQPDHSVEGEEVDVKVLGDRVDDFDEEGERRGGHDDHKRLSCHQAERDGADGLAHNHLLDKNKHIFCIRVSQSIMHFCTKINK